MVARKGQFKKGGGRVVVKRRRSSHNTHRGRSVARKTVVPVGIIAGMLPGVARSFKVFQSSGAEAGANEFMAVFSGYDVATRTWSLDNARFGLFPLFAGLALHKIVGGMFGINRLLAQSKIPLLRI